MKYVLNFYEIDKNSIALVGGKGANLGELTKAGFSVPKGFCITTEAFKDFVFKNNKFITLISRLEKAKIDEIEKIEKLAENIRLFIKSLDFSEELENSILNYWKEIGEEKSYAIRSSATAEDLPNASFAGQQDTYLNIKGKEKILESVKNCFASLFTNRAVFYRIKNNFSHKSVFLSVIVQEMIFSDFSGIMFSADPISGRRNLISINSSFGLGEALVGGIVLSDLYQVYEGKIIKKEISQKKIQIIADENGGTIKKEIISDKQKIQSLCDNEILELALIGKKIENHYESEQDIEWCFYDKKFFIVQSRPITSIYPFPKDVKKGLHFFFSVGHFQMMTDAMKPLGASIFQSAFFDLKDFFKMKNPFAIEAGSRLYIDLMNLLEYKIFQKIVPKAFLNVDEKGAKIMNDFMKKEDFKSLKAKNITLKRKYQILIFALGELKLFLFGKLENFYDEINYLIDENIKSIKKDLQEVSPEEKIGKIKNIIETIPKRLINTKIIFYMPLALGSYKLLGFLSKKWLGDTKEVDALGMAPKGNITTEMGLVLGDIADLARKNTKILSYLEKAVDVNFWEDLKIIEGGKEFYDSLSKFFEKYGVRCTGEIDITRNRWKEKPRQVVSLILDNIKGFELGQHRKDFILSHEKSLETSKNFLERIKKTKFGFFKVIFMKRLIYVYRSVIGIREHPKFFLVNILGAIKDSILEETKKLINENIIKEKEDIYYFSLDEIDEIIKTKKIDLELLETRKMKFDADSKLKPPRVFDGEGEVLIAKPNENIPIGAISGTPASAGIVEGIARVVKKLEEANLREGDILITSYTDPAWTTLFGIASAVITEVGGILTHGAVVAREYGIPAIVGVDNATSIIHDGAKIRVNGNEGYIEILE